MILFWPLIKISNLQARASIWILSLYSLILIGIFIVHQNEAAFLYCTVIYFGVVMGDMAGSWKAIKFNIGDFVIIRERNGWDFIYPPQNEPALNKNLKKAFWILYLLLTMLWIWDDRNEVSWQYSLETGMRSLSYGMVGIIIYIIMRLFVVMRKEIARSFVEDDIEILPCFSTQSCSNLYSEVLNTTDRWKEYKRVLDWIEFSQTLSFLFSVIIFVLVFILKYQPAIDFFELNISTNYNNIQFAQDCWFFRMVLGGVFLLTRFAGWYLINQNHAKNLSRFKHTYNFLEKLKGLPDDYYNFTN